MKTKKTCLVYILNEVLSVLGCLFLQYNLISAGDRNRKSVFARTVLVILVIDSIIALLRSCLFVKN